MNANPLCCSCSVSRHWPVSNSGKNVSALVGSWSTSVIYIRLANGNAALYRAAPPMMKTSSREPFSTSCAQMPNASSNEAHTSQPGRELSVVLTTMLRRPGNAPWGSDSKVCLPMIMACPQVVSLKWARSSGRCQGSVPSMPIARLRAKATMMLTMGYESFLFSILADRCCWPVGQCFSRSPTVVGGK